MHGSQEEHGRIYYTLPRKAKQRTDHMRRAFERPAPQILYSPNSSHSSPPMLPHTGQSSQLPSDHDLRGAQFLPAVARSALNLPVTPSREHRRVSAPKLQRVTVTAHSGQSSQLVF